jgi:HEPN domain-containing protein
MTENRTTSAGLWRFSKEYLQAAALVSKAGNGEFSHPSHFLFGRSIELALKAFLLARGVSLKELRNPPLGHNLRNLLQLARRRRLGTECKLSAQEIRVIELLDQQYSSKRHEYIVTGSFSAPKNFNLLFITTKLVTSLDRYCVNSTYPGMRT